ncbi:MAG: hypothetical protein WBK91_06965 [Alphaproteobacteria bacterium]
MLQLSAKSYMALCALVHDAMQVSNDAAPILAQVASELALTDNRLPIDLRSDPKKMAALRQSGFIRSQKTPAGKTPFAAQTKAPDTF